MTSCRNAEREAESLSLSIGNGTCLARSSDARTDIPPNVAPLTLMAAFLGWFFDGMEMGIFRSSPPALQQMQMTQGIPTKGLFSNGWDHTAFFLWGGGRRLVFDGSATRSGECG